MTEHKVGDRVMIYELPETEEKPEGWAVLVKQVMNIGNFWIIEFEGECNRYYRTVV